MKSCTSPTGDHIWVELGECSHAVEHSRFGMAVRCSNCGLGGHRWHGFLCARGRTPNQHQLITAEREKCLLNAPGGDR